MNFFFFFCWSNVIIFFFFFFLILDKFVLKIRISRRVSYFVNILSRVGNIFLPGCP